jgi:hypothetical protein
MSVAGRIVDWAIFRLTLAPGLISLMETGIGTEGSQLKIFEILTGTVLGLVDGLILGVYQWVALRRKIEKAWTWIPATMISFAVALTIFYSISTFVVSDRAAMGNPLEWGFGIGILDGIVGGLVLGLGQWFVLRKKINRSIWWIPGTLVAMLAAWFVRWYLHIGFSFFVPGMVTGIVLIIQLTSKPAEEAEPSVETPTEPPSEFPFSASGEEA